MNNKNKILVDFLNCGNAERRAYDSLIFSHGMGLSFHCKGLQVGRFLSASCLAERNLTDTSAPRNAVFLPPTTEHVTHKWVHKPIHTYAYAWQPWMLFWVKRRLWCGPFSRPAGYFSSQAGHFPKLVWHFYNQSPNILEIKTGVFRIK